MCSFSSPASWLGRTTTRSRTSSTSSTRGEWIAAPPLYWQQLGPGGLCHVESTTPRQITSVGDEDLVMLVVGAKDGYVGRDGRPADPSKLG